MGFHPVIDGYSDGCYNQPGSEREVLTYGGGATLFLRTREPGSVTKDIYRRDFVYAKEGTDPPIRHERPEYMDQFGRLHPFYDAQEENSSVYDGRWLSYHEPSNADGNGDITSLTAFDSVVDRSSELAENVIVGRANGQLDQIRIFTKEARAETVRRFVTDERIVRSGRVSHGPDPLLATALGNNTLAIYPLSSDATLLKSTDEVLITENDQDTAILHSIRFLTSDRLVTGSGHSRRPVMIYALAPHGIEQQPLRVYGPSSSSMRKTPISRETVFRVEPVRSSLHDRGIGQLFLSGRYDGETRLHDLRSPSDYVALFYDPSDLSAVYSILPMGRDRFLTGSADGPLIKVFDFRMPGHTRYRYPDTPESSELNPSDISETQYGAREQPNFNIYLNPTRSWSTRRNRPSAAVYSLFSPSPTSSTIYAGLEDQVVQIDITESPRLTSVPLQLPQPSPRDRQRRNHSAAASFNERHPNTDGPSYMVNGSSGRSHGELRERWLEETGQVDLTLHEQVADIKLLEQVPAWLRGGENLRGWHPCWRHKQRRPFR
ncbi:hypothetical protein MMC25_005848 [Agyrium rufum]|nr:hypothetical protein [Agyrium rufum]